jgi:hypothetical protein
MPLKLSPTQLAFNARGDGKFSLPFQEQIDFFRQKINLPTEHYDDILAAAHNRAFVVAGALKADLLNDLRGAVDKAIADGKTIQWFRKEFAGIIRAHGWEGWTGSDTQAGRDWRTRVIYSTNIQASYNAGRYAQLTHPDLLKYYPNWKYIHNDTVAHPRPLHKSWSGTVLPHDDPWWDTHFTPNGYGCRCRITSANPGEYKGQPAPNDGTYEKIDRNGVVHTLPKGVDYGFDYKPGAPVSDQMKSFIGNKAASLPEELGKAFKKDMGARKNSAPLLSSAFELPKNGLAKTAVNTVLMEIDGLHSTVELPKIPVKNSTSHSFQGRYVYLELSKKPVEIAISKYSVNPELTAAHEIGHFIDHQALWDIGTYASVKAPVLENWRAAIEASAATENLKTVLKTHSDSKTQKRAAYYLSAWEQWARSYAQWVATRSNNTAMIEQVQKITKASNPAYSASQWDAADFEPIALAIDEIFIKLGWLR